MRASYFTNLASANNDQAVVSFRWMAWLSLVCIVLLSSACTTMGKVKQSTGNVIESISADAGEALTNISIKTGIGNNPDDPLEGYNRAIYSFNEGLDEVILKPAANGYKTFLPEFVQAGIGNFFANIGDIWTAVNNLLQGKFEESGTDLLRLALNTTFGLGGVIDVASREGLPKHLEDFGQTLGVWGVKPGPYFVLPLFGPSTVRDALALPIDLWGDILFAQAKPVVRYTSSVVRVVDKRAAALDATNLLEEAALDKYVFTRDGHLQRRAAQVNPDAQ